jgi:3-phosphoshikimate 1-carboxyvinyltransferase
VAESTLTITPARAVAGTLRMPGDKSISHRYAMLGAIARGTTRISGLAPGADVAATCACVGALGVGVRFSTAGGVPNGHVTIDGRGWEGLSEARAALDARNSGTSMRLLAGIVAGRPFRTVITGDASLSRRPMRRVLDPLAAMGAGVSSVDGHAPITIDGRALAGIMWTSPVASAQVKSAVMLAALSAAGTTTVTEPLRTRDHTERAFPAFGLTCATDDRSVSVPGGQEAVAPDVLLTVPGDPSSAAVWASAAAAFAGGSVRIDGVCLNPRRLGFVRVLERMGARVTLDQHDAAGEPCGTMTIRHDGHHATAIAPEDIPDLVDELPVLAARAALGGALAVSGAGELRVKESDRITALVTGLRELGVRADERPDGFIVDGSRRPTGGTVDAAGDHRLVMAFAVVGLGATGPTRIRGASAVDVSYPGFTRDLAALVS